jgi:hypothetical protein
MGSRQFDRPSYRAIVCAAGSATLDAPGADQQVYYLANGDPMPAQNTRISRRRNRDPVAGLSADGKQRGNRPGIRRMAEKLRSGEKRFDPAS